MTPFPYSGTRRPTVEILPMPAPLPARTLLFFMFALGFVSGMAVLLAEMAMWP